MTPNEMLADTVVDVEAKNQVVSRVSAAGIDVMAGSGSVGRRSWLRYLPRTRTVLAVLVVAALLSVAVAAAAWFVQYRPAMQGAADRAELVATVSADLPVVLSYAPDTIDADVEAAQSRLTGDYADYYSEYANSTLIEGATNDGVSTETVVQTAALADVDGDSAHALAYLTQTITARGRATPTQRVSTVRVELTKVDGMWKISSIDPI